MDLKENWRAWHSNLAEDWVSLFPWTDLEECSVFQGIKGERRLWEAAVCAFDIRKLASSFLMFKLFFSQESRESHNVCVDFLLGHWRSSIGAI